jgi:hypothetical protein
MMNLQYPTKKEQAGMLAMRLSTRERDFYPGLFKKASLFLTRRNKAM